jgi:hypothetical protein
MEENKHKGNVIAFLLGFVLGGKVLPWFIHLTYIGMILIILFFKK